MIGPRVIVIEEHRFLAWFFNPGDLITHQYFETVSCADQDRWSKFLKALASDLSKSGLGSLSDKAMLNENEPTSDLLVELRHVEYGRAILKDCVQKNNLSIERPIIPQRWRDYRCDEYFADSWWAPEHYRSEADPWGDVSSMYCCDGIYGLMRIYEDFEHEFLAIAGSGCDGIDFGYRKGHEGLWAYYPGEDFFELKAPTIPALYDGWCKGDLSV